MKIVGIILGLVCSFQVLDAFEGFYVGGEVGGFLAESKQQGEATAISFGDIKTPIDLRERLTQTSGQGGLYAGYGMLWNCLYLGGEVFAEFNSIDMKSASKRLYTDLGPEEYKLNTNSCVQVNNVQYGLDLRPGWAVTPFSLLYGRMGVGRSHLKLNTKSNYSVVEFGEVGALPLRASAHRSHATLRLGVGLEHHLTPHLSLRGDYIFTDLGTIHTTGATSGITSEGHSLNLSDQTRMHLQQHSLMLGLSYYFCPSYFDCNPFPCDTPQFCGYYLGGALGGFFANDKRNINATGNQPFFIGTTIPLSGSPHVTDKNFEGMVFFGRGWQRGALYLGAEVFGDGRVRDALKRTDTNSLVTFDIEQVSLKTQLSESSLQGGIDFRPGICITPSTLLCGRVGTSVGSIKARTVGTYRGNLSTVWDLNDEKSKHFTCAALRLGGGLEQALFSKLHVRLDYCFTNYGRVSLKGSTSGVASDGLPVFLDYSTSDHLVDHSVLLGFSYYFP